MSENLTHGPIESIITELAERDDPEFKFSAYSGPGCRGLRLHGMPTASICDWDGCEANTSLMILYMGGVPNRILCPTHLLEFIEHEKDGVCEQCSTWFDGEEAE